MCYQVLKTYILIEMAPQKYLKHVAPKNEFMGFNPEQP